MALSDPRLSPREHVPLAPLTSFGIGGSARYLIEAADTAEVLDTLRFAREKNVSWCVIGGGTNIVVSDRGMPGLVIRMSGGSVDIAGATVTATAGVPLMTVIERAAGAGLAGMELLAGIPGTLGGAVRGNAGAFGAVIGDLVDEVYAVDSASLNVRTYSCDECRFGYRSSRFKKDPGFIILGAKLSLLPGTDEEVQRKTAETVEKRGGMSQKEKSAGSFFLNPELSGGPVVKMFEEERQIICRNCRIPAGWLIERAGLRGTRLGGAMVSERHANYIINTGTATAQDVRSLADMVRKEVHERLGVELEEEVSYIGF